MKDSLHLASNNVGKSRNKDRSRPVTIKQEQGVECLHTLPIILPYSVTHRYILFTLRKTKNISLMITAKIQIMSRFILYYVALSNENVVIIYNEVLHTGFIN